MLYLRRKYHFGPTRIVWYLDRYHDIKIPDTTVSRILRRHGLNRLPRGTQQLNGKVERSHRSDLQEFYQLLSYKDNVDLEAKLEEWGRFYNFHRPHGEHDGKHLRRHSEKSQYQRIYFREI